ncbi:T9SS type A sorting domain-containing protein [Flavobacterium bizetiae]|uniref:T9SS type A sorting domain-containing protein n=1 Tax=Flavobacterium bizetiae TaxID=2704140 RepID=UPI0037573558
MKKTLLLIFFLQFLTISAQNPTEITHSFGSFPGFNDKVTCIMQQSDGKIILGGNFTCYQGSIQNRLIRLNTDGSKDITFDIGLGFNYDVTAILLQPDGKIIVGGEFNKYQGLDQAGLIRLNTDGSKDKSFKIKSGGIHIYSLALQSDGDILVGGGFKSWDGISQENIARLDSNGELDRFFKTQGFSSAYVKSLIVQADGKILAEGNFSSPQNQLVRLNKDGSTDFSFNIKDDGFKGDNIKSVALQADGKILVAGTFSKYKGINENGLIRLNTDGSKDTSFKVGTGFNKLEDKKVESYHYGLGTITIQSDGKILVMGDFTSYQGTNVNGLIRLNTDGSRDNSFEIDNEFGNDPTKSKTLALQSDGKLLVGWEIKTNQGISQMQLVRLNNDGTKDPSLSIGTGLNFSVNSIVQQNDGKILVGGDFTKYKEVSQNNIIRLNSDKSKDNSFSINSGFNGSVNTIALQKDGKIIVGGKFTKYQEAAQSYLIRLNSDGTKDSAFSIGTGFDKSVNFVAIQPDGKILVGGDFRKYQGISQNYLIRLNTDGSKDATFNIGSGFYNLMADGVDIVKTILLQSDGKILVGGNFEKFESSRQYNLIRLNADGTKDTSFDIGTGFNSVVYSLTLQPDQKIIVGGPFDRYKGITQHKLIRLNTDGSKDNSFDVGLTFKDCMVYNTVLQNNGKIIVGSYSRSEQRVSQNNLVRLNTDGSRDNSFGTEITFFNNNNYTSTVYSILLQPNDQLLIGGDFTAYQGNNLSAFLIGIPGNAPNLSNEDFNKENKSFSLWPNPVQNILNINSLNESNYSIKIYDLLGRLIYAKENVNTSIDVSSFTSGLYLIKIKAQNGETSQKFIKI